MSNLRTETSMLVDDSVRFYREQRLEEQRWKSQYGKVRAANHEHELAEGLQQELGAGPEAGMGDVPQHPLLRDKAWLDGIDPGLSINPNPVDVENALREQDKEKQYRLGLQMQPGHQSTPKPSGF